MKVGEKPVQTRRPDLSTTTPSSITAQTTSTSSTETTTPGAPAKATSGVGAASTSYASGAQRTAFAVDRQTIGQSPTGVSSTVNSDLKAQLQSQQVSASTMRHGAGARDSGFGLNGSDASRTSASGRIPAAAWDNPAELVGNLTQTPASGPNVNSAYRCAPSNLLGAALLNGPDAAARMLDRVATSTPRARLPQAEAQELQQIAGRIRNRTASYEDLSRAQGLLYQAGNTRGDVVGAIDGALASGRLNAAQQNQLQTYRGQMVAGTFLDNDRPRLEALLSRGLGQPTSVSLVDDPQHPGDAARQFYAVTSGGAPRAGEASGYDDAEVNNLASSGGVGTGSGAVDYNVAHPLQERLQTLRPGESVTLRVQGQDPENGGSEGAPPDHFVTVGRRPDGTAYIYNPDPANGDYTLYTGRPGESQPADFTRQLESYERRLSYDNDGDQPLTTGARF